MQSVEQKLIRVKLFGSLSEFAFLQSNAEISIPAVSTIPELKRRLDLYFRELHPDSSAVEILKSCAFAGESAVLSADADLSGRTWIAVLPPVCGG